MTLEMASNVLEIVATIVLLVARWLRRRDAFRDHWKEGARMMTPNGMIDGNNPDDRARWECWKRRGGRLRRWWHH